MDKPAIWRMWAMAAAMAATAVFCGCGDSGGETQQAGPGAATPSYQPIGSIPPEDTEAATTTQTATERER